MFAEYKVEIRLSDQLLKVFEAAESSDLDAIGTAFIETIDDRVLWRLEEIKGELELLGFLVSFPE